MSDLISVIIPAYNHENYVQEAIQSVIDQTYDNIELIVIDDGSKDSTWEKICEMKASCEKKLTNFIFKTQVNQGVCNTLNNLLQLANGEYVHFFSSDDKLTPKATEILHDFLSKHKDYALAVGKNLIMDGDGKHCYWNNERENVYDKESAAFLSFTDWLREDVQSVDFDSDKFGSYESLLDGNYIPNGYLIRKNVFEKIGYFTGEAPLEDWWLALQISKYAKMKYIDEPTFFYRWHDGNTMSNSKRIKYLMRKTGKYEITNVKRAGTPEIKKIMKEYLKNKDGQVLFKIPFIFELYKKTEKKSSRVIIKIFGFKLSLSRKLYF